MARREGRGRSSRPKKASLFEWEQPALQLLHPQNNQGTRDRNIVRLAERGSGRHGCGHDLQCMALWSGRSRRRKEFGNIPVTQSMDHLDDDARQAGRWQIVALQEADSAVDGTPHRSIRASEGFRLLPPVAQRDELFQAL